MIKTEKVNMVSAQIISPAINEGDGGPYLQLEQRIRPKYLNDYIGQIKVKQQLEMSINAARRREETLDHVLLFGPPGLGKTTLANIIATEMGVNIRQTSGPVLEKIGDLAAIITNLQEGDVLFIDEIHRLSPNIEEVLYPALEDGNLDIIIGEGPAARAIKLDLPRFTLVGATTRAGLLTAPLRDRFGIMLKLDFYQEEDLQQVVMRAGSILSMMIEPDAALEIARRARGTPRIANRLLRRIRDYATLHGVEHSNYINHELAVAALDFLEVDIHGLDPLDRSFLHTLAVQFDGGPAGIDSVAAALGEDKGTLEDILEPYLIQKGFLVRTPRGRLLTMKATKHLQGLYTFSSRPEDF